MNFTCLGFQMSLLGTCSDTEACLRGSRILIGPHCPKLFLQQQFTSQLSGRGAQRGAVAQEALGNV